MSQNVPPKGVGVAQIDADLSPQQHLALGHLLAGRSYSDTARLLNVDRQTIYRWRKDPAFIARLEELSREALEAVAMRVRGMLLHGTEKLERKLRCESNFNETLRLVSNKRIWDIANTMLAPIEEDESDGPVAAPGAPGNGRIDPREKGRSQVQQFGFVGKPSHTREGQSPGEPRVTM